MAFEQDFDRERARYEDGMARPSPEQLVRVGNAAYGAGLALLMLGRQEDAAEWLQRAALRWRESWEHATPTSWGRPIGAVKASLLGNGDTSAYAEWTLDLGTAEAESPIGRYAAALALLVLDRAAEAVAVAATLVAPEDFPPAVADALAAIAAGDAAGVDGSLERVLVSFEDRDEYLDDVAVADTVLVLELLALLRGLTPTVRRSALLPA